ncbi:hypothetical protein AA14337_1844 [Acetobacter malorum DSM 14337]|uniref:Uncharacterized protein n=1 Tax=Acetobacter malorum DSM 14337 TaxID=1307910 RepID=A0ABQ0PTG2_9PROT|nr:hypothetical protein AA14337_1844 [Acetobacter malorum DSM 14337]
MPYLQRVYALDIRQTSYFSTPVSIKLTDCPQAQRRGRAKYFLLRHGSILKIIHAMA